MLSGWDMYDIIMIDDPKEREAALDSLSNGDAREMLKELVRTMRNGHDEAREVRKQ